MRYLIQIRFNGADAVIRGLSEEDRTKVTAEFEAVRKLPGVLDGSQLAFATTAKTVQVHDGETHVTDGLPVAQGAELDGYYIFEAADPEAAIAFASRIPVARMGGTVEVRPMMER